jgi:ATP-binding cassette subfamily B (MDR/TAP) protein 1
MFIILAFGLAFFGFF